MPKFLNCAAYSNLSTIIIYSSSPRLFFSPNKTPYVFAWNCVKSRERNHTQTRQMNCFYDRVGEDIHPVFKILGKDGNWLDILTHDEMSCNYPGTNTRRHEHWIRTCTCTYTSTCSSISTDKPIKILRIIGPSYMNPTCTSKTVRKMTVEKQ